MSFAVWVALFLFFFVPSPSISYLKVEDKTVHKLDVLQKMLPREQQDSEVCLKLLSFGIQSFLYMCLKKMPLNYGKKNFCLVDNILITMGIPFSLRAVCYQSAGSTTVKKNLEKCKVQLLLLSWRFLS